MKYNLSEVKSFKVDDIKDVTFYKYEFNHVLSSVDKEEYLLTVYLKYTNNLDVEADTKKELLINFPTTMTENLKALVSDLKVVKDNDNVNVYIDFIIDIEQITSDTIEEEKEEIKDDYQEKLEEIFDRNDGVEQSYINHDFSYNSLKSEYVKYKVISLNEEDINKISSKYKLDINYLYAALKKGNKVIIYDDERV